MSKNYASIVKHAKNCQRISSTIIDEFLLYYAASQKKLNIRMEKKFKKYKHLTHDMDESLVPSFMAQYISHRIFKKKGMIRTLLNHSAVKERKPEEYEYLKLMSQKPWHYSFSRIVDRPADKFFIMEDVFNKEEFLLYSNGIHTILETETPILWFNLIGFDGEVWETFGPILYFNSFVPDDIFFFASEVDPDIENESDLMTTIERDPLPFMMLINGSHYPLTFVKSHEMVYNVGEFDIQHLNLDPTRFSKDFEIQKEDEVYRFGLKGWNEIPHFAKLYYDAHNQLLILMALTDEGYKTLVHYLRKHGITVPLRSAIRVHPSMVVLANKILKNNIPLDPYSDLFAEETDPAEQEAIDELNALLAEIVPLLNEGREIDVTSLAQKYDKDPDIIHDLIRDFTSSMGE